MNNSTIYGERFNDIISCLERKKPPQKIRKIVHDIEKTRSNMLNNQPIKDTKQLLKQLKEGIQLQKMLFDTDYLRFVFDNCTDEYIKHLQYVDKMYVKKFEDVILFNIKKNTTLEEVLKSNNLISSQFEEHFKSVHPVLSCVENKNPPKKVSKILHDINATWTNLKNTEKPKNVNELMRVLRQHFKLFNMLRNTDFLRFVIENCSEKYIKMLNYIANIQIEFKQKMVSNLNKSIVVRK